MVTGGTSGLGLLTGRWLAQRGASFVALASRSGAAASSTSDEMDALRSSGVVVFVERCDVGKSSDAYCFLCTSQLPPIEGVWHAAWQGLATT